MHQYLYPRAANTSSVIAYTTLDSDTRVAYGMRVLLVVRGKEPFAGKLALPGGFHDADRETLEETAQRELREETSIDVGLDDLTLFRVQSEPKRDPREHVIDHVYSIFVPPDVFVRAKAGDDACELKVLDLYELQAVDRANAESPYPNFAFDHGNVLQLFINGFDWRYLFR